MDLVICGESFGTIFLIVFFFCRFEINERKIILVINELLFVISPEKVHDAIKTEHFERNGYLAYITFPAYYIGIYDVGTGKIHFVYICTNGLIMAAFLYCGKKMIKFFIAAQQFYGTLHLMGQQFRQRETIMDTKKDVQKKPVEVKPEQKLVVDEEAQTDTEQITCLVNTFEASSTPIIQSIDRGLINRTRKGIQKE